ncbi:biotin-dependent carboxyltransferase family protein [uncultured Shimia sp.]|uniref:5-oxoprolinase subunit C family protein n=1 Tax=uncultured Shimia sp. TaxID=573152 RepID=UPI0026323937|nr:biotin-dependent carboxyltransferase family protein [uncultured Shimia sp.]
MSEATLKVQFAGPLVTVQDAGRQGQMRFGVPGSGPMDRLSFAAANIALGNPADAPCIEISMGGLMLECISGSLSLAVAGGDFSVDRSGEKDQGWLIFALESGDKLSIRPGMSGSWTYLAFSGNLSSKQWLGHAATHASSGFGGGQLQSGQVLEITQTQRRDDRHGPIVRPSFVEDTSTFQVVLGPQDAHFSPKTVSEFVSAQFALSDAFDRMGVRLTGPELPLLGALSIPSEPVARGSVQVSGEGIATVLLADHQTTGGYPKIATLLSYEADRLGQLRARDEVRFSAIAPEEGIRKTRAFATNCQSYLDAIAVPKGTLEQRLMRENLISGVVTDNDP